MNKKRWIILGCGLVGVFALTAATSYLAARHLSSMRMAAKPDLLMGHSWDQELGLTPEQKTKLDPLNAALQKDLVGIQTKLAEERVALCSLMMKEGLSDQGALDKYVRQVSDLEGQQQRRVVEHLLAMRDVLTADQKEKFFTSIMQNICEGCRTMTHSDRDICAMCRMKTKG